MSASLHAYILADAILRMARRMAASQTRVAYAAVLHSRYGNQADQAERERHTRAAQRQHDALYRLTAALRDLDGTR